MYVRSSCSQVYAILSDGAIALASTLFFYSNYLSTCYMFLFAIVTAPGLIYVVKDKVTPKINTMIYMIGYPLQLSCTAANWWVYLCISLLLMMSSRLLCGQIWNIADFLTFTSYIYSYHCSSFGRWWLCFYHGVHSCTVWTGGCWAHSPRGFECSIWEWQGCDCLGSVCEEV